MRSTFFGRYAVALVAVCSIAAATGGCSKSSSDDNGGGGDDAAQAHDYYVQHVHNALQNCQNCHVAGGNGPTFMARDPNDSYSLIEGTAGLIQAPKNSPLVQYIHKDQTITINPEQRSVLTTWLGLETSARGLSGAVAKAKTITDAYQQFAKCMSYDAWSFYRMDDLAFTQTDSEGPCLGCHSTGQGSAWMSADSRLTYEKAQQFPFIQKLVVGKLDGKGSFENLQPSNRFIEKANEVCPPGSTSCHPRFGLPPAVQQAIQDFVQKTLEDITSGTCGSGIVVPISEAGPLEAGDGG
jgi:hypothetical protein